MQFRYRVLHARRRTHPSHDHRCRHRRKAGLSRRVIAKPDLYWAGALRGYAPFEPFTRCLGPRSPHRDARRAPNRHLHRRAPRSQSSSAEPLVFEVGVVVRHAAVDAGTEDPDRYRALRSTTCWRSRRRRPRCRRRSPSSARGSRRTSSSIKLLVLRLLELHDLPHWFLDQRLPALISTVLTDHHKDEQEDRLHVSMMMTDRKGHVRRRSRSRRGHKGSIWTKIIDHGNSVTASANPRLRAPRAAGACATRAQGAPAQGASIGPRRLLTSRSDRNNCAHPERANAPIKLFNAVASHPGRAGL